MDNKGLQLYLTEVRHHKEKYVKELEELRKDLLAGEVKSRDYLAAERLLQVFTEVCIGLAKHWVKKLNGGSASDAYQTFSLLKERGGISGGDLKQWRKIIGLRNGLVHDYLNIDLLIIEDIIRQQQYNRLDEFCDIAINALLEE